MCDENCPRFRATGKSAWKILSEFTSDLLATCRSRRPDFPFYFTIWNQDKADGQDNIRTILSCLDPSVGICMSISDNVTQVRKSGPISINQPWSNVSEVGELFRWTAQESARQGRAVMVFGEICQSEVWDPVCHNFPSPLKQLKIFQNAETIPNTNAVLDFWGHRRPWYSHANLALMEAYFDAPSADDSVLLRRAAQAHFKLDEGDLNLLELVMDVWRKLDGVVDDWALTGWAQRFSFAIGRAGARGRLYFPLVPPYFKMINDSWDIRCSILHNGEVDPLTFARFQNEDCEAFIGVASRMDDLAKALAGAGKSEGSTLARREARTVELAGELIASVGRTVLAVHAYGNKNTTLLRQTILNEIEGRERQLRISGEIGFGGGVNQLFVQEDLQLMRFYLSSDDFPNTPDCYFRMMPNVFSA
jgi:hypothetical protein